eukprot:s1327_g10.t1
MPEAAEEPKDASDGHQAEKTAESEVVTAAKGKGKGKEEKKKSKFWISWDSLERRLQLSKWVAFSCSKDHTAKIWELNSMECRGTLAGLHEGTVRCAVIDWKELMVITGSDDGSMCLWSLDRCECKEQWLSNKHGQQTCLAADWENQRAVSGTAQGKLCLWDSKRLALLSVVAAHPGARINKVYVDVVIGLAVTAAEDGRCRTWDVTVPELTCVGTFDKHGESVSSMVIDFNKNRVMSGASDGSVQFWHLKTRSSIALLSGHTDKINSIVMDLQKAIAVTASDDETARVWDLQSFAPLGVLEGHTLAVRDLTADFEEMICVTCSDDTTMRIWEVV